MYVHLEQTYCNFDVYEHRNIDQALLIARTSIVHNFLFGKPRTFDMCCVKNSSNHNSFRNSNKFKCILFESRVYTSFLHNFFINCIK